MTAGKPSDAMTPEARAGNAALSTMRSANETSRPMQSAAGSEGGEGHHRGLQRPVVKETSGPMPEPRAKYQTCHVLCGERSPDHEERFAVIDKLPAGEVTDEQKPKHAHCAGQWRSTRRLTPPPRKGRNDAQTTVSALTCARRVRMTERLYPWRRDDARRRDPRGGECRR